MISTMKMLVLMLCSLHNFLIFYLFYVFPLKDEDLFPHATVEFFRFVFIILNSYNRNMTVYAIYYSLS